MVVPQPRFTGVSQTGDRDNQSGFPGGSLTGENDNRSGFLGMAPDQPLPPYTSLSRLVAGPPSTQRKSELALRQANSPPGTAVRNTFIEVDERGPARRPAGSWLVDPAEGGAQVAGHPQDHQHFGLRGHAGSSHLRCGSEPPRGIRFSESSSELSSTARATLSGGFGHRSSDSSGRFDHRWECLNEEGVSVDDWHGRAEANYDCPLNSNADALAAVSGYAEWMSTQGFQNHLPEGADAGTSAQLSQNHPPACPSEWLMGAVPQHGLHPDPRGDFGHTAAELAWTEQHFHQFPDSVASRPPGHFAAPSKEDLAQAMRAGFQSGVAAGMQLREGQFGHRLSTLSASGFGGPFPVGGQPRRASHAWTIRAPAAPAEDLIYESEAAPSLPGWKAQSGSGEAAPKIPQSGSDEARSSACEESQTIGLTPSAEPQAAGRSSECQVVWCDARAFKEASDAMRRELEQRTQIPVKAYKSAERCIRLLRRKQNAQGRPRCIFLISWSNAPALVPFLAFVPHIVARVVLLVETGRGCHHEAADHLARLFPCVTGVAQTWAEALDLVAAAVKDHQAQEA